MKTFPLNKEIRADFKEILIVARNTGRILIAKKPSSNEWFMWENFRDDTGYTDKVTLISKSKMRYNVDRYRFMSIIGVLESEFFPSLSEDIQTFKWIMLDDLKKIKKTENFEIYFKSVYNSLDSYNKQLLNEYNS